MTMRRPFMNPLLPGYEAVVSTAAQEARAIEETARNVQQIKEVLAKADLPVSAFDTVAQLFLGNLHGVVAHDLRVAQNKRAEKIHEIVKLSPPPQNLRGISGISSLPGSYLGHDGGLSGADLRYSELDMFSDADLDAELARVRALPR